MKEVQHGDSDYLNEYTEYDKDGLKDLYELLLRKLEGAEQVGLTAPFVRFNSTLEPYEDCSCGPVEVQIRGQRPLTRMEKAQEEDQAKIQALADKLGVTFYEAATIDRMKRAGKVEIK